MPTFLWEKTFPPGLVKFQMTIYHAYWNTSACNCYLVTWLDVVSPTTGWNYNTGLYWHGIEHFNVNRVIDFWSIQERQKFSPWSPWWCQNIITFLQIKIFNFNLFQLFVLDLKSSRLKSFTPCSTPAFSPVTAVTWQLTSAAAA